MPSEGAGSEHRTTMSTSAHVAPFRRGSAVALCGLAAVLLGYLTASAAGHRQARDASIVTVTAGKPSEFAFTLSAAKASAATVRFKVTNKGAVPHQFKVCTTPAASAKRNACVGKATKVLKHGQRAVLTVTFMHPGTYEFLSGLPGQAAKGLKGLFTISSGAFVAPAATTAVKTATTSGPGIPSATPATPTIPTTTPAAGAAAAGAAIWTAGGCSSCHSLDGVRAASGGNISASLNATHSGGPFPNGALTATQISQLQAYING